MTYREAFHIIEVELANIGKVDRLGCAYDHENLGDMAGHLEVVSNGRWGELIELVAEEQLTPKEFLSEGMLLVEKVVRYEFRKKFERKLLEIQKTERENVI